MTGPEDILGFWLGLSNETQFVANPELDAEITAQFGALHAQARTGELDSWLETPSSALALIILLDQFARNIHRNTPDMFSADETAREIAARAIDKGHDLACPADQRIWFYLPFQHSEDLADQDLSVDLTGRTGNPEKLQYAKEHRDIIVRFGRFPHRNAVLDRQTTPEEQAFLDGGGFSG